MAGKTQKDRENLINKMKSNGAFWSYSFKNPGMIPDNVLIEETLRWGDVEEILILFCLFPTEYIEKVWQQSIIPDERLQRHNYYLARIFFNIRSPEAFMKKMKLKNNRYERIKKLAS